jgi:YrbI family 3-deoxy-D-manno-octulosonate 8-phosphate phosphatase
MKLAGWFPAYSHFGESYYLQSIRGIPCFILALQKLQGIIPNELCFIETDSERIQQIAESYGYAVMRNSFANFNKKPHLNLLNQLKEIQSLSGGGTSSDDSVQAVLSLNPILPFVQTNTWQKAIELFEEMDGGLLELSSVYPGHRHGKKREAFVRVVQPFASVSSLYTLTEKKMSYPKNSQILDLDELESIAVYNQETALVAEAIGRGLPLDSPYLGNPTTSSSITGSVSSGQFPGAPHKPTSTIKLLVSDVDGVLTDAGMYYSESGDQFKKFNAKDGIGIKKLQESGREIALLSTGVNENLIRERAKTLKIERIAVGKFNKLETLEIWKNELGLKWSEIAFIGDDINDLTVIEHVGLFACPSDAIKSVRDRSHIILEKKGGEGCVREFIDRFIL